VPLLPATRTTTSLDVKVAAVAAIEAAVTAAYADDPDGVPSVSFGIPNEADWTRDVIALGGFDNEDDWAEIGRGARDENYTITLVISCSHDGWTQQENTTRAIGILQVCDRAVTGAQLLPPPGWVLLKFGRCLEGISPSSNVRVAEVVAGIRVYARL
jgi:hypothetical protein